LKTLTELGTKKGGAYKSSIYLCRQFYIKYAKFQTVSGKLSWSHYAELLTVSGDLARSFYEKQAIKENWGFREMKRQIDSALFQRLALSTDKKGVLALAEKGHEVAAPKDLIKNPYVWEFLDLPKDKLIKERGLEKKLVENLQQFLLELGKGFSFIGKQYKITVDNELIGIIIAADRHEFTVKYATGGLENRVFVSKYQLYLPDQKQLEEKVKEILEND